MRDYSPESDFDFYQRTAMRTNMYDKIGTDGRICLLMLSLGMCGEAGEAAEKVKKFIRDGVDEATFITGLSKELGDTLWYLSQVARYIGKNLSDIAIENLQKLESREMRGVVHGNGDNR